MSNNRRTAGTEEHRVPIQARLRSAATAEELQLDSEGHPNAVEGCVGAGNATAPDDGHLRTATGNGSAVVSVAAFLQREDRAAEIRKRTAQGESFVRLYIGSDNGLTDVAHQFAIYKNRWLIINCLQSEIEYYEEYR